MMDTILSFTDAALAHIRESIANKSGAVGFRLGVKETGCTGLMYVPQLIEEVDPNDFHQTTDGVDVYIPQDAIAAIKGTAIDYVSVSLGQKQLSYNNPNADSLCGCGESFNLKHKEGEGEA